MKILDTFKEIKWQTFSCLLNDDWKWKIISTLSGIFKDMLVRYKRKCQFNVLFPEHPSRVINRTEFLFIYQIWCIFTLLPKVHEENWFSLPFYMDLNIMSNDILQIEINKFHQWISLDESQVTKWIFYCIFICFMYFYLFLHKIRLW